MTKPIPVIIMRDVAGGIPRFFLPLRGHFAFAETGIIEFHGNRAAWFVVFLILVHFLLLLLYFV